MHKRLFSYGMFIYAVGFVAALALNVDLFETQAEAPHISKTAGLPQASPLPLDPCAAAPSVQVVAADVASPASGVAPIAAPCAAKATTEILAPKVDTLPIPVKPASLETGHEL